MRKYFVTILLLLLLGAIGLTGCFPALPAATGEMLNEMIDNAKLPMTLTVKSEKTDSLTSTYRVSEAEGGYRIDYTYMRYLPIDPDGLSIPESFIETYEGYGVVKNGEIVETGGAESEIDLLFVSQFRFDFTVACFASEVNDVGLYSAVISKPELFLGHELDGIKTATVDMLYENDAASSVVVRLTTDDGYTITYTYEYS